MALDRLSLWEPAKYERSYGHVIEAGSKLVEVLEPVPGEHIADLGCGTGRHTAEIAARGAHVIGLDADEEMIEQARQAHPGLWFEVADGHDFALLHPVHAIFSNAALHWMTRPAEVIRAVHRALKPDGRFVAEMCAAGSLATLLGGLRDALDDLGLAPPPRLPWYFPEVDDHVRRLEEGGFRVRTVECFDRPRTLPEGLGAGAWWRKYGADVLQAYAPEAVDGLLARIDARVGPPPIRREGVWLRFSARRCAHLPGGRA